ncbi:MAG: DUF309 domain-containing protein [Bryobacterales bacterium]|nr:DUF309 domain-containing protein [Bryobacterales bacterium]
MLPDPQALFAEGIALFNRREFFRCHEVLEELWTPAAEPDRTFLQSLIHFAVAFHHHQRHNPLGATRQLHKGLRKLQPYLPAYQSIRTDLLLHDAARCLAIIESGGTINRFPSIERL